MQITTRKVLTYACLPQVVPRFRGLMSGFTTIAFFLAQVYRAVGLLPKGHPYLLPGNMGRFGITHVVAEAGLLLRRRNASIDQIAVYWLLMLGMVVLAGQIVLLLLGLVVPAAHAATIGISTNFFITKKPEDDLAFILLDRVFGVPDLFKSCVQTGGDCLNSPLAANTYWTDTARSNTAAFQWPTPFNRALQSGFQLYSVALLCISALILCYFVFAILAETAESGTPFGKRFNKVWAPLRLVVAMGLLIPIANGLNAAQYITLYAAKFGSGFATNGWNMFVETAVKGDYTVLGDKKNLIAIPNAPPINTLVSFMALVGTCKKGVEELSKLAGDNPVRDVEAYQINPSNTASPASQLNNNGNWDYEKMAAYAGQGNIVIRFGEQRMDGQGKKAKPVYTDDKSNVEPTCGEIIVPATNADKTLTPGSFHIMHQYLLFLGGAWLDTISNTSTTPLAQTGTILVQRDIAGLGNNATKPLPTVTEMQDWQALYQKAVQISVGFAIKDQADSSALKNTITELEQYGWAGAGIWYNRIAQLNGSMVAAVYNMPTPTKMPEVMEQIQKSNLQTNHDTAGSNRYRPYGANGQDLQYRNKTDAQLGVALAHAYDWWAQTTSTENVSSNIFVDAVNAIFGTNALFSMSQNQSANINPLAELAAAGRGILESATRNLGWAWAAGLGGGMINVEQTHLMGTVGLAASGFLWSFALTGLSIGFLMYYVIPFLPFIYFFFAVGSWVKTIFEAMVGVPLWAMAHLRIDGHGLPGDAAMGGYFLLLDIFLRPILIIFGMIGGIIIFSAQASILNNIWSLVTSNITGFDRGVASGTGPGTPTGTVTGATTYLRDAVDQLFFSVIYAIIIYMLGMSTFKMVDQVPSYILRWMGANVQTFGDRQGEEVASHLMRNSFAGTQTIVGALGQSSPGKLGSDISQAGQSFARRNS